ncbi:unnamed protein product [Peronospora farinosa]|uniref:Calponin-homology (CH) domain-containing protein n=1 Tax=Peronospora farinosa TaxID=134698 RepID=A0ABN8C4Q2_9STRA|nr:unnamed protein product [Peronospora farinosa]
MQHLISSNYLSSVCVVLGKQLNFSLVNVGGADIFEGAKKMNLSIVWHSMRYRQLKILNELAASGPWRNHRQRYRRMGKREGSAERTGKGQHRVIPGPESTDDAKASNAKYTISCAQKIGATVFLTYEDIVEVKPKMMMTFVASLMLVDHQRKASDVGFTQ